MMMNGTIFEELPLFFLFFGLELLLLGDGVTAARGAPLAAYEGCRCVASTAVTTSPARCAGEVVARALP